MSDIIIADLVLSYLGRDAVTLKGDLPGHEFRGNQYSGGGGGGGESGGSDDGGSGNGGDSGSSASSGGSTVSAGHNLPKPKILKDHEIQAQFVNKKGSKLYTLQKPIDNSERGWAIVTTARRDKGGTPVHFYEMTGKRDEVTHEYNTIKRYEG